VSAALFAAFALMGFLTAPSPELLDSLRVHAPNATQLASEELARCELSRCADVGPLSLLVGTLRLSEGDAEGAKSQLAAHPAPDLLGPYLAYYQGEAAFYTQDYREAVSFFARAAQDGSPGLAVRAKSRQAEALLAANDAAKALPVLNDILADYSSAELLFDRARAYDALHDPTRRVLDLRTVVVHYPLSPQAQEVEELFGGKPPPALKPNAEERLTRARAFLEGGSPAQTLAELALLDREHPKRPQAEQAQAALLRVEALYATGKDPDAEAQVKKAARGDAKTASEALLFQAKHLMKGPGEHPEAQKLMANLERRYPGQPAAEEAGFLAGWLLIQDGKYGPGAELLAGYDGRHPHARKRDEAAWYRSYALVRAGQLTDAESVLSAFGQHFPRSQLVPQARYWLSRCHQLSGRSDALVGYRDLIAQAPGSFYAVLAAERLREAGQVPPPLFNGHPNSVAAAAQSPELQLARALARAGLLRDAAEEIARRASAVHSVDVAYHVGQDLTQLEEHGAAFALAARLLWGEAYGHGSPAALALLYPRAFAAALETNAKARDVSPYLLWAIMRRESAFRPNLMSAANARGLMQLIPPTAASISKALREDPPPADALFSPFINLKLSAWYLAQLQARFAHPVLVAAAYNAGPPAAARWAKTFGELPTDLFVEAIPYRETRAYVKQVVADIYNYQQLYGDGGRPLRLSLQLPGQVHDGVDF
jgi:soluble lytic murein transglycosylase